MATDELLRRLPSVDRLLRLPACVPLIDSYGRLFTSDVLKILLETARREILSGANNSGQNTKSDDEWIEALSLTLKMKTRSSMRHIINCSGVVIHTNLGRSTLADVAGKAAMDAAVSNVNLEYDVFKGGRGDRDDIVEGLITELTGAEAATVVNNNAAAVLLVLNTLSDGRETIVSRGELIEIGGSFRLPEIMEKSGCFLKEVGTTNRTHITDYESAVSEKSALVLRAHTSNFRIVGFTSQPELKKLKTFAKSKNLPLMVDLGSGTIVDLERLGLTGETTVSQTLNGGADIVTISGDKLLGGPQSGIIMGRRELILKIKKNPLKRALRCDKMTIAALESTLRVYRNPEEAVTAIPTLRRLIKPVETIRQVAGEAVKLLQKVFGGAAEVFCMDDISRAGSGSLPEVDIPSVSVGVRHKTMSADEIKTWFRNLDPPIIGRVENDLFRLDMRGIDSVDDLCLQAKK